MQAKRDKTQSSVTFAVIGDVQHARCEPTGGRIYSRALPLLERTVEELNRRNDLDFVVNIGDMGDGRSRDEIPAVLDVYRQNRVPVCHVVGNHDFVQYSETELHELLGTPDFFYDFEMNGVRFLVLNGLDESRFSPPGGRREKNAMEYRARNTFRKLRNWDGKLSDESLTWLRRKLEAARNAGELVILLNHVPVLSAASGCNAVMWNHREILELLDHFPNIRGYFAGHYHPGGIALRKGVLHKTVRAICDSDIPTASVVRVFSDRIELAGIGRESDFVFPFEPPPATIRGTAPAGAFVMTDTGEITRADADGKFLLTPEVPGIHALKAVADGKADAYVPMLTAPADGVEIVMCDAPGRHVVSGKTDGFATLKITDDGVPVRSFDLAGNPFGGMEPKTPCWHENSVNIWSRGEYAFSVAGDVAMEFEPYHSELRRRGWFKGDFHAHVIHGEALYRGNLPLFAFAARAEGYDWLYAASNFADDGVPTDYERQAEALSDEHFLFRLNSEFPKNRYGHIGNLGVGPIDSDFDETKITDFELAETYLYNRSGVAVPVHPLFNDNIHSDESGQQFSFMTGKEVFLWLLCKPEMCPCLDLFYNDNTPGADRFWFNLLNRGYRIGFTATSDAAFDVGRTPGGKRGATFVRMPELTESALLDGMRQRRTMVGWDGAAIILEIDGHTSGDILPTGGKHELNVDVFYRPGRKIDLRIIRNGKTFRQYRTEIPDSGKLSFHETFSEAENSWYLAILRDPGSPDRIKSATSPVYFRDESFVAPEVLPFPRPFPDQLRRYLLYLPYSQLISGSGLDELKKILTAPEILEKMRTA